MKQNADLAELLPAGIEAVFAALDLVSTHIDPADRDTLSFNILLNALTTVLERLRAEDPDEHRLHLGLAQALLREG